ncbi:MAG: EAL domain-containing protein [Lachnospiraceae bacterium]|nr:EAL domain-containing protein [Lachnospiraceae bacterium]
MKKYNPDKLKKIHVYPLIIILIIVVFIVGVAISLLAGALFDNLTRGKISQGYKWAQGFYSQIKEIDLDDKSALDDAFSNYSAVVNDVTGVTVSDGETVLYQCGEEISDLKTDAMDYSGFIELYDEELENYTIYLDTAENAYFDKFASGNLAFIQKTLFKSIELSDEMGENADFNEVMNMSVFEQTCYYGFKNDDGTVTYVALNLHIIVQDVILVELVCVSISLICFIYLIFVIFMFIRFVRSQRRLLKLYYADKETGGKNWYYFLGEASKKMKKYRRKNVKAAMVHIRMEKYRNYCSCYGDKEGRALVGDFYDVIRRNITKKETFARHEMCDFGLLICYENEGQLVERIEKIMGLLDAKRPNIKLYFKAGINILDGEIMEPSEAYNRATIARAKIEDTHNENVSFFTQQMKEELLWERKVENDMERALINHEYKVYLQPKYSVDDEKLAAAEALVRWVHPTEGLIAPYKFIPIFERNGFITKLDDYMIAEVAKLQAKWIAEGKKIVPISVNVSRAHFTRENLAEHICEIVDSYKVPHEAIELELTESAFFDDKETLIGIVNKMKDYGFAVSMDDFGAGYSSLNSLKELPIDVVKLDAEFFRGNDEEGKGKVIVSDAISLAKKLNMRIVAEGIETREQVDFLAENECDLIQGYYFAKPMPVEEFEVKVAEDA